MRSLTGNDVSIDLDRRLLFNHLPNAALHIDQCQIGKLNILCRFFVCQTNFKREFCVVHPALFRQHDSPQIIHARICAAVIDDGVKFGKCGLRIMSLPGCDALTVQRLVRFGFWIRLEFRTSFRAVLFNLRPSCTLNIFECSIDQPRRCRLGFKFGGLQQILFGVASQLLRNQRAVIVHARVTSARFDHVRQLTLRPVEITGSPRLHDRRHLICV